MDDSDTERLRPLRKPSRLEAMTEALVTSCEWLGADAYPVIDASTLPYAMRKLAQRAERNGWAWRAWMSEGRLRFFTANVSTADQSSPTLQVTCFGEKGNVVEFGRWSLSSDGSWRRLAA